jgi:hypothetical protein
MGARTRPRTLRRATPPAERPQRPRHRRQDTGPTKPWRRHPLDRLRECAPKRAWFSSPATRCCGRTASVGRRVAVTRASSEMRRREAPSSGCGSTRTRDPVVSSSGLHPHAISGHLVPHRPIAEPALSQGFPRERERFMQLSENRGVPGSSPGFATANRDGIAVFFFLGPARRAVHWVLDRVRDPGGTLVGDGEPSVHRRFALVRDKVTTIPVVSRRQSLRARPDSTLSSRAGSHPHGGTRELRGRRRCCCPRQQAGRRSEPRRRLRCGGGTGVSTSLSQLALGECPDVARAVTVV